MYDEDCEGTTHFFDTNAPELGDICQCGDFSWREISELLKEQERIALAEAVEEAKSKVMH